MQACISAFLHLAFLHFPVSVWRCSPPRRSSRSFVQPAPANWGLTRVGKVATDGSRARASDGTGVGIYIVGTGVNSQPRRLHRF